MPFGRTKTALPASCKPRQTSYWSPGALGEAAASRRSKLEDYFEGSLSVGRLQHLVRDTSAEDDEDQEPSESAREPEIDEEIHQLMIENGILKSLSFDNTSDSWEVGNLHISRRLSGSSTSP
jgi:hypothetical protein